jgi:hypothetical protein
MVMFQQLHNEAIDTIERGKTPLGPFREPADQVIVVASGNEVV